MTIDILEILIHLLLGGSLFVLIWALFRYPVASAPPVHRRIALAVGAGERRTLFEQKALAPVMSLMMTLARRLNLLSLRRLVHRNLDASGNPQGYSVDEYLAICLFTGIAMAAASALVALVMLQQVGLLLVLTMGLLGFAIPLWVLHEAAGARMLRVSKQLPYALDLIALMLGAGSTFTEAVETVVRDAPEQDLNQELRIVQAEIEFGAKRAEALRHMAERVPLETLRSVVGAVNQAEALGTPLSQILKSQSDILRMHRSVRAEKLSASASLRILVPTMLIMVAVVLLIFGPYVLSWLRGDLGI